MSHQQHLNQLCPEYFIQTINPNGSLVLSVICRKQRILRCLWIGDKIQNVGLSPIDAMKNADHVKSVIAALRRDSCIYDNTALIVFCVEPLRGCWAAHEPLPLTEPGPSLVSPVCELQEAEHVSTCLCHETGCNAPDDFRSREPKQIVFPSDSSSPRTGRQSPGLRCFSCGSLFDRSSPPCDKVTHWSMLSGISDTILFSSILMTTARLARVVRARRVCCTRGRNQAQR